MKCDNFSKLLLDFIFLAQHQSFTIFYTCTGLQYFFSRLLYIFINFFFTPNFVNCNFSKTIFKNFPEFEMFMNLSRDFQVAESKSAAVIFNFEISKIAGTVWRNEILRSC